MHIQLRVLYLSRRLTADEWIEAARQPVLRNKQFAQRPQALETRDAAR